MLHLNTRLFQYFILKGTKYNSVINGVLGSLKQRLRHGVLPGMLQGPLLHCACAVDRMHMLALVCLYVNLATG